MDQPKRNWGYKQEECWEGETESCQNRNKTKASLILATISPRTSIAKQVRLTQSMNLSDDKGKKKKKKKLWKMTKTWSCNSKCAVIIYNKLQR